IWHPDACRQATSCSTLRGGRCEGVGSSERARMRHGNCSRHMRSSSPTWRRGGAVGTAATAGSFTRRGGPGRGDPTSRLCAALYSFVLLRAPPRGRNGQLLARPRYAREMAATWPSSYGTALADLTLIK